MHAQPCRPLPNQYPSQIGLAPRTKKFPHQKCAGGTVLANISTARLCLFSSIKQPSSLCRNVQLKFTNVRVVKDHIFLPTSNSISQNVLQQGRQGSWRGSRMSSFSPTRNDVSAYARDQHPRYSKTMKFANKYCLYRRATRSASP